MISAPQLSGRGGGEFRIGVDARSLLTRTPRGEGKTLLRLYQELSALRPEWRFVFYGEGRNGRSPLGIQAARQKTFEMPGYRWNLWENVALPLRAMLDGLDLLHCPGSSAPGLASAPVVMTVHDIIPLKFDDGWSADAIARFKRQLAWGLRTARRVICVSTHTRNDLLSMFDLDESKLKVIHWGVDVERGVWSPNRDKAAIEWLSASGIRAPYVMAFAGSAKRKNTQGILEAFARAASKLQAGQLVLIGAESEALRKRIMQLADAFGIRAHLVLLGFITDEELEFVYRHASCLLFLSLYEGFGLPVLDAMARGVPVIAKDATSVGEIASDAAVLVKDQDDAAEGIAKVLRDRNYRETMISRGYMRAESFDWRTTAMRTAEVLESAYRASSRGERR